MSETEKPAKRSLAQRSLPRAKDLGGFIQYVLQRFQRDDGMGLAAGLSYTSLLALVPLFAIALAILAAFPAFESFRESMQRNILENFVPERGGEVAERFTQFIENASALTAPGIVALAVTAVLLLMRINRSLNVIWRVREPRPVLIRLLIYWALLTVGPLLLGGSMTVSGYVFALVQASGIEEIGGGIIRLSRIVSIALAAFGFAFFFKLVPNRVVEVRDALIGGVAAALLLELLKWAFGLYLRSVPSYEAVYGALAIIPIFLVWLYLVWIVVLLAAELTAALPEWNARRERGHKSLRAGGRLLVALAIIETMRQGARKGQLADHRDLADSVPALPVELDDVIARLVEAGLAVRTHGRAWVLARDLDEVTLGELIDSLGLTAQADAAWPAPARNAVRRLQESEAEQRARPLSEILDEGVRASA